MGLCDVGGPALVVSCVLKPLLSLWAIGGFSYLWERHTDERLASDGLTPQGLACLLTGVGPCLFLADVCGNEMGT